MNSKNKSEIKYRGKELFMINKYEVILLAAGKGERMCLPLNKIFYKDLVNGKMLIEYSIDLFLDDRRCEKIVIVYNSDDENEIKEIISKYNDSRLMLTTGGPLRQESVRNGLKMINSEYVLVHDGARCNLKKEIIDDVVNNLGLYDCCVPGVKVSDTIKKTTNNSIETLNRDVLYYVQTPQGVKTEAIMKALEEMKKTDILVTDESEALERYGKYKIKITNGRKDNIKITTQDDLKLFEYLVR